MHKQTNKKLHPRYHQRSLDDIIKQIRKQNLKSERHERHLSPKPLLYMYNRKNNYTMNTLERSRTVSNKASVSRKTNKSFRKKVQRMLSSSTNKSNKGLSGKEISDNPGDRIEYFTNKLREVEKYLEPKSKLGAMLCHKFLEMLNDIVENMVSNLQRNIDELEANIALRLQKEISEKAALQVRKIEKKLQKLQRKTFQILEKQNLNSNLIYHLRMSNLDIDREFGRCIYQSDDFGGSGYYKSQQEDEHSQQNESFLFQKFETRNLGQLPITQLPGDLRHIEQLPIDFRNIGVDRPGSSARWRTITEKSQSQASVLQSREIQKISTLLKRSHRQAPNR